MCDAQTTYLFGFLCVPLGVSFTPLSGLQQQYYYYFHHFSTATEMTFSKNNGNIVNGSHNFKLPLKKKYYIY